MKCTSPPDTFCIRDGTERDLPEVAAIQAACSQAAQWEVGDYLQHSFLVAQCADRVTGFTVVRGIGPGENELLTLAVSPLFRRKHIGQTLLREVSRRHAGALFLEVRESNLEARSFYQAFGFQEVGRRPQYYENPSEAAVVMKFHSC